MKLQIRSSGTGVASDVLPAIGEGLRGVIRGKSVRTTVPDAKAACPLDRVNCEFRAERPNQLWVSDFTYVSTWQGFVYVPFVIDVFERATSSAGASAARCIPTSCSTPWSRRCTRESRSATQR
jgi:transposase InsO family protein